MPSRAGSHRWTQEHKQLLCVLSRFLKVAGTADSHSIIAQGGGRILGRSFASDISGRSPQPSLTDPGIRRRLYELRREGDPDWKAVFVDTDFADSASRWSEHRERLVAAAAELNIRLTARKQDHQHTAAPIVTARRTSPISRTIPSRSRPRSQPAFRHTITHKQAQAHPATPSARRASSKAPARAAQQPSTPSMTRQKFEDPETSSSSIDDILVDIAVPDDWDDYSYEKKLGRLIAYRVISPHSHTMNSRRGSWPTAFTGKSRECPKRSSAEFLTNVVIHLTPKPEPSWLLSVTPGAFTALRHALSIGSQATILVVDLGIICKGKPPSRLTPAKRVIQKHLQGFMGNLKRSPGADGQGTTTQKAYRFHGNTELLIWGPIGEEAIISAIGVPDLRKFLNDHPTVDQDLFISKLGEFKSAYAANKFILNQKVRATRRVGRSVGALVAFLGLGKEHAERAARQLKDRWGISRHNQSPSKRRKRSKIVGNGAYMMGFYEAYNAKRLSDARASFVPENSVDSQQITDTVENIPEEEAQEEEDELVDTSDDSDGDFIRLISDDEDMSSPQPGSSSTSPMQFDEDDEWEWYYDFDADGIERLPEMPTRQPATLAHSLKSLKLSEYRWKST